jgi:beta-barrel assembly-enhancing protease
MTSEEERKLGKKVFLDLEQGMDLVRDLPMQAFLDRVGRSLIDHAGVTPFEFKFFLVRSKDPNAFAIPGGYIFVSTGLIVLAENEQEVAGVLGHEISHVTGRHVAQMIERAKRLNIATLAAMLVGAVLGGGGRGSEAAAMTAMAASQALMLKYTRENEVDADQNGLRMIIKAGYDPAGLISFLKKLQRFSLANAPKIPAYLSTHPATEDRIALMENLLQMEERRKGRPVKEIAHFKRLQARAFTEEREPDAAINHFESLVKTNPQDADAHLGLGLAFEKKGRLDKAAEAFQTLLSLTPTDPEVLSELGAVYFLSGKIDPAIQIFEEIRALSAAAGDQSMSLQALLYLGRGYQEKGAFSQALPLFLKIQKEAPNFIEVYRHLGSVYGRMGQKGLSHLWFGKYFKMKGERENALLHFGTALEALEKESPEREEIQREVRDLKQPN